jgi:hypothetical protein
MSRAALGSQFDAAVERQQPPRVLGAIARDSVRLFAPTRAASPAITPISRWQFQDTYPVYPPEIRVSRANVIVVGIQASRTAPFRYRRLSPAYGGKAQVDRPVAAFLRSYQLGGGYTPGPLLAIFALAGLLGSLAALCRRPRGPAGRELALGGLLFFTAGAAILLVSDVYEFSWRHQLPALVTLPAAGVLAISLLIDKPASRRQARPDGVTLASRRGAARPARASIPVSAAGAQPTPGTPGGLPRRAYRAFGQAAASGHYCARADYCVRADSVAADGAAAVAGAADAEALRSSCSRRLVGSRNRARSTPAANKAAETAKATV